MVAVFVEMRYDGLGQVIQGPIFLSLAPGQIPQLLLGVTFIEEKPGTSK